MDLLCCCRKRGPPAGHTFRFVNKEAVALDHDFIGEEAVVVKNGTRLCGCGAALANVPLMQNKSYWEVKIQTTGQWALGVGTRSLNLNILPLGKDEHTWVLRQDGGIYHKDQEIGRMRSDVREGDVISVSYDHIALRFYINGAPQDVEVHGIRGSVYPVLAVDDGAILDIEFRNFVSTPPAGFDYIILEQSIF